jgi:prolyl oligopeptidase
MIKRSSWLVGLTLSVVACGEAEPPPASPANTAPPPPLASAPAPAAPALAYPPAPQRDVVDTYGSGANRLTVHDPYRWLEDSKAPEVEQWSDAENAVARRFLDAFPGREALAARMGQLLGETSPSWSGLATRKDAVFLLERRPPKQHPFLVVTRSLEAGPAAEKVLVDPNELDPSGATDMSWYVPSFDGKRVAVSLARGGAERGNVHVFDVATGKDLGDDVPQADGIGSGDCLAWKKDGSGFFYTRGASDADKPKGASEIYERIWFHRLGKPASEDVVVLGKDAPPIAQWELVASEDGRFITARMEYGDGGQYDQWLLGPPGKWTQVAKKDDGVRRMSVGAGDSLYLLSLDASPRGKVLRTSLAAPSLAKAEVAVPEGQAVIEQVIPTKSRLYLLENVGGPSQVRSVPAARSATSEVAVLETPPVAAVFAVAPLGGDDVAVEVQTYFTRTAWYRTDVGHGGPRALAKTGFVATTTVDMSGIEAVRETCTSKDGTKVPLNILRTKGTKLDGTNATILTGYGGYGIAYPPFFDASVVPWLEQGGVFAIANLRGGGEFGETWHRAGNLLNKQNVFDDFYACAQRLVETRHTSPQRLGITGASNGGLLMGAELTQHPDAFKAVVSQVGDYDMLRVELDPNGPPNTAEFGTVKDPEQLRAMYAYSPYHHVQPGTAYPATLFMTGKNDPRVSPYHSRKMTARLQAATATNPSAAPILLRTEANAGHGMGSALHVRIEEETDLYTFFFQELGVAYRAR